MIDGAFAANPDASAFWGEEAGERARWEEGEPLPEEEEELLLAEEADLVTVVAPGVGLAGSCVGLESSASSSFSFSSFCAAATLLAFAVSAAFSLETDERDAETALVALRSSAFTSGAEDSAAGSLDIFSVEVRLPLLPLLALEEELLRMEDRDLSSVGEEPLILRPE